MFCSFFEELVYNCLNGETKQKLEESSDVRKIIFENLTVGVNVYSMECYQKVAEWLLTVPEKKLKKITMDDVIAGAGDYIDDRGCLA